MRSLVAIVGIIAFAAIAVFATTTTGGAVRAAPAAAATPPPRATPIVVPTALPDPETLPRHLRLLQGFRYPVARGHVPSGAAYLPNSPREYRAGYHEGIDFPVPAGTAVLAAKNGHVVRIDNRFIDWSVIEERAAFAEALALGYTPERILDRIRGRQVWIDHGGGIVTRYAHLGSVGPMQVGSYVEAGTVIGTAGSSGLPEGGPHVHFEIRVGAGFYGEGLAGPALRRALAAAFR